jgi:guanine nucleotide-binding protein subunit alpha
MHYTEDVLKARIKTMGVIEHTFMVSSGRERGPEWKIYDVGGARNQRQAWVPYFEDGDPLGLIFGNLLSPPGSVTVLVTAIIFLAPISAFDQVLAEVGYRFFILPSQFLIPSAQDTRVNRLEDSLLLWKSLVSNKLLASVNIVLFLNKCDLLMV